MYDLCQLAILASNMLSDMEKRKQMLITLWSYTCTGFPSLSRIPRPMLQSLSLHGASVVPDEAATVIEGFTADAVPWSDAEDDSRRVFSELRSWLDEPGVFKFEFIPERSKSESSNKSSMSNENKFSSEGLLVGERGNDLFFSSWSPGGVPLLLATFPFSALLAVFDADFSLGLLLLHAPLFIFERLLTVTQLTFSLTLLPWDSFDELCKLFSRWNVDLLVSHKVLSVTDSQRSTDCKESVGDSLLVSSCKEEHKSLWSAVTVLTTTELEELFLTWLSGTRSSLQDDFSVIKQFLLLRLFSSVPLLWDKLDELCVLVFSCTSQVCSPSCSKFISGCMSSSTELLFKWRDVFCALLFLLMLLEVQDASSPSEVQVFVMSAGLLIAAILFSTTLLLSILTLGGSLFFSSE